MPSSERLFNILLYALWVLPAAVVVTWVVWRAMVWCLYYTALVSAWVGRLSAILQVPIVIALLLLAWPLLLLALFGWLLIRIFPGLAVEHGEVPSFCSCRSQALSYIFLSFLILLPVVVPLRYLADRLRAADFILALVIGLWSNTRTDNLACRSFGEYSGKTWEEEAQERMRVLTPASADH